MARIDIDPDTGYPEGVAQRPDAPFPEASNVPADVPPQLEDPDRNPDAFGSAKTAAPDGVEDATIEEGDGHEVPKEPVKAAEVLNDGKHEVGNEYENTSVAGYHEANTTNAETLSQDPKFEAVQTTPNAKGKVEVNDNTEPKKAPRRGRRPAAEKLAEPEEKLTDADAKNK
ncbi:hypothetical protein PP304_gp078 [Gordonia phage Phendrix]|uniref:Uncharacterized protein n=1 Tax=Gordonia phage Phendrix TaxID=2593335 RepID=A0A514U133_9CAUD|nr:hypothetical protein PP304_gp078 [Gordonia phage Phendrix]QDK02626.1 hypothetical protein SEA_PHENDRIX_78 [Gordonia phage Phendrix]